MFCSDQLMDFYLTETTRMRGDTKKILITFYYLPQTDNALCGFISPLRHAESHQSFSWLREPKDNTCFLLGKIITDKYIQVYLIFEEFRKKIWSHTGA